MLAEMSSHLLKRKHLARSPTSQMNQPWVPPDDTTNILSSFRLKAGFRIELVRVTLVRHPRRDPEFGMERR